MKRVVNASVLCLAVGVPDFQLRCNQNKGLQSTPLPADIPHKVAISSTFSDINAYVHMIIISCIRALKTLYPFQWYRMPELCCAYAFGQALCSPPICKRLDDLASSKSSLIV